MIKRIRIENYKALRDVTLDLSSIHVLIGPNDSGKTSILEAIAAFSRSVDHPLSQAFTGSWQGRQLVWLNKDDLHIALTGYLLHDRQSFEYSFSCYCSPEGRNLKVEREYVQLSSQTQPTEFQPPGNNSTYVCRTVSKGQSASAELRELAALISDSLKGVQSYRWDGRFLALPNAPDAARKFRMEPSGFGLALCLDEILGYDRDLFMRLEQRFRKVFPAVKSIKLIQQPAYTSPVDDPDLIPKLQAASGKGLYFEFEGIQELISAAQVSDGVLLVLAYLTILHLPQRPRVLLIEEPENGIHPERLKVILSILKELIGEQSQTQVILTTHSPYAVDLFDPEEVTLCKKEADGSVSVHRLSESQAVLDQRGVFTLGEIWTSEGDESLALPAAASGDTHG